MRYKILSYWYTEILRDWNTEILRYWDTEILRYWNTEIMRYWDTEILRCQYLRSEMLMLWTRLVNNINIIIQLQSCIREGRARVEKKGWKEGGGVGDKLTPSHLPRVQRDTRDIVNNHQCGLRKEQLLVSKLNCFICHNS